MIQPNYNVICRTRFYKPLPNVVPHTEPMHPISLSHPRLSDQIFALQSPITKLMYLSYNLLMISCSGCIILLSFICINLIVVMILDHLASKQISAFCASFLSKRVTPCELGASSFSCPKYNTNYILLLTTPVLTGSIGFGRARVRRG